jgi:hypothetical protein
MLKPKFIPAALILAFTCLGASALRAAQPPSLIVHKAADGPWVMGVSDIPLRYGKVKIFTEKPVFDEDGELVVGKAKVTTLRNPGDEFTIPRTLTGDKYWIIFYPSTMKVNFTLTLRRPGTPTTQATTLNVKQLVMWGRKALPIEVKVSDNTLLPNVDNFEDADSGALLTLD